MTTLVAVALAVIAACQIVLAVTLIVAARRAVTELAALGQAAARAEERLEQVSAQVGKLASDASETLAQVQHAAGQVGAIAGAGRSLVEGALGLALWRRVIGGAAGAAAGGASTPALVRTGVETALGIWRAVAQRRAVARQRRDEAEPLPGPALGTGRVRRVRPVSGTGPARGMGA